MAVIQAKKLYSLGDSFEKCILINRHAETRTSSERKKKRKEKKLTSFLGIFDCCCYIFISLKKAK